MDDIFRIEREKATLLITPLVEMGEFDFERIEDGAKGILSLLDDGEVINVIIDLHNTNYVGTTALGWFVRLWKRVCKHDGQVALCGVSEYERDVLRTIKLDTLWPIYSTMEEARKAVLG
ncbi:MAG: STAS domain-containing protein, partial [Planctomycetales bacterium]